ncbi:MAG: hypothetical protein R3F38_20040 [Gammaproteobacteria bacterium]
MPAAPYPLLAVAVILAKNLPKNHVIPDHQIDYDRVFLGGVLAVPVIVLFLASILWGLTWIYP